jgi:hypothetical protein
MRKWKMALDLGRGNHRYFQDQESAGVSVCDNSGRVPEETDDGIQWIARDRPVRINMQGCSYVPTMAEDGSEHQVLETALDALHVAKAFDLKIVLDPEAADFVALAWILTKRTP